jgi:Aerobic-type carbon monoxide dehydrogenase, small subunit CoxS/CutS homologs
MPDTINFELNGKAITLTTDPLKRLVDVLRDELDLTGTKEGCGEGECGACAVLINNKLVNSCLVPAANLEGQSIVTIEGYKNTEKFKLLKACFEKAGSVQCGFCTPGMILAAEALLLQNHNPSEADARAALAGNLCRCTGYNMIIEAILLAAKEGEALWSKPTDL